MLTKQVSEETLNQIDSIMERNRNSGIQHFYLFLDFDGVINIFLDPNTKNCEEILKQRAQKFDFADRKVVKRIDTLLNDFPIDVVISSSWRFNGLKFCQQYLKNAGLKHTEKVIDITEPVYNVPRQQEIADYLIAHPDYSGFLIIDDDPMPEFKKHWLETYPYKGFDDESSAQAYTILKAALIR